MCDTYQNKCEVDLCNYSTNKAPVYSNGLQVGLGYELKPQI